MEEDCHDASLTDSKTLSVTVKAITPMASQQSFSLMTIFLASIDYVDYDDPLLTTRLNFRMSSTSMCSINVIARVLCEHYEIEF